MNQVPSVEREPAAVELRRVKIVFAALYFFFMLARAVFGPFITLYLEEKGLSPEQIGLITGINSFIIIISPVSYTHLDVYKRQEQALF